MEGKGDTLTAWLRRRAGSEDVIYAGFYSVEHPPRAPGPCVKVVFPLPNGSASVFLMPHEKYTYISSRLIKEVASFGTSVAGMVPALVEKRLAEKYPVR